MEGVIYLCRVYVHACGMYVLCMCGMYDSGSRCRPAMVSEAHGFQTVSYNSLSVK